MHKDKATSPEIAKRGVLVRLTRQEGDLALRLDDIQEVRSSPKAWTQGRLITFKKLDAQVFDPMQFDEKELAGFGYYILAVLAAFVETGEAS